jgi:outer membrane protein assembly factor BamB
VRTSNALLVGGISALALGLTACGGGSTRSAKRSDPVPLASRTRQTPPVSSARRTAARPASTSPLGLPPVSPRSPLPGYLLIADRNNDRVLIVSPGKRIVWLDRGLRGPDDSFFTPGYRSIITNEEFNDTLTEVSLATKAPIWRYGHDAVPGSSPGYLNTPDDAYRLRGGVTTVADVRNCRIVQITRAKRVLRVLGGVCGHDPPRAFASPNGDTPLPDGGLLVSEIGPPGWIDRLDASGRLVWAVPSPVAYPSDAQLLPNGRILVAGFTNPGRVVELTRTGRITWSFGLPSGPDYLNKPSLAARLPNGLIAATDDWNHRVIVIDPHTNRIVWQYGHTGLPGASIGYLDKPDGLDLLPASAAAVPRRPIAPTLIVSRIGTLPRPMTRVAAVALPGGKVAVLGGLAGGISSAEVLLGPPGRLLPRGTLPAPTHDAAATFSGGSIRLYGGGRAVSQPDVVLLDAATGAARRRPPLDEPLSDLGGVTIRGRDYLVGGYTGSRYAAAILRVGRGDRTTTVARLPVGLRYAGVAALGGRIYVAGGVTPAGSSDAVYRIDPTAGTVLRIGTLSRPIAHAPLVASSGALYLVGGESSAEIFRIDPRTGAVAYAGSLPRTLPGAAAVAVAGRVIVLGGDGSDAVYSFSTD